MHELAITESIVTGIRERFGDTRVTRVILEIGKLTAIVPDSIRFCFEVCTRETPLEGAALEIIEIAGAGRCRSCDQSLVLTEMIPFCRCGSVDVEVQRGEELLLRAVEVE